MFRLLVWLKDGRNRFWLEPTLAVLVALLACAVIWLIAWWFPELPTPGITDDALTALLQMIGTSMLAVTTFSLGIVVSATTSVSNGATPRATEVVMADEGTRRAISAFVAAFVYAVVARTATSLDVYGRVGRFLLLVLTLLVLLYLVARLVLWIRTVSRIGRLADTLDRLESVGAKSLKEHACAPHLGARVQAVLPRGHDIAADRSGFVTHVDLAALQKITEAVGEVHVLQRPGAFVHPAEPIVRVAVVADDEVSSRIRGAFVVSSARTFEQDPRYALLVCSEVGQRALSPGVNDPGTAIQVMSVLASLLIDYAHRREKVEVRYPSVTVPALDEADLIHDSFDGIARDGAGNVDVTVRLQKLLAAIRANAGGRLAEAAAEVADTAHARALATLELAQERERLAAARG